MQSNGHWLQFFLSLSDICGTVLLSLLKPVRAHETRSSTLLHDAALSGHRKMIELLLAKGANVNITDEYLHRTSLHKAAATDRRGIAELLIAKGADVNAKDNQGRTPLNQEGVWSRLLFGLQDNRKGNEKTEAEKEP
jgi:ankyrin repeat protein